ncbi:MAG: hypothetical protein CVU86_03995 [Firmicutes bacterium HGW-Firmicutes-11]|jgi:predicted esterase YcpF (UPF0227 family)|nr:MAG: hypothetical protein CVU86_03995 [Firmicutes bacterium HGW-Firmicutes-11]
MHAFIDNYSVAMTALLTKNYRWFSDSIDSPGFRDQLRDIAITLPTVEGERFYEIDATSSEGRLDPAFHVVKWHGPEYPTIIYHHGNNENPFNYGRASKNTFKSILYKNKDEIDANLISLRAPYHNNDMKYYFKKMARLSEFTAMLSTSVNLVESLVQMLQNSGCSRVAVAGLSLGGWVTNLHRSFYNSANLYIPIFAGASLGELFLTSCYQQLSSDLAKGNPEIIRTCLNFDQEFKKIEDDNVYPLLAKFDQIIEYNVQSLCYEKQQVAVINKGHITGALSSDALREHILRYALA